MTTDTQRAGYGTIRTGKKGLKIIIHDAQEIEKSSRVWTVSRDGLTYQEDGLCAEISAAKCEIPTELWRKELARRLGL